MKNSNCAKVKSGYHLVHVTNIPTPYRISFFNRLKSELLSRGIDLTVVYTSFREPRRLFSIDKRALEYDWIDLDAWGVDLGHLVLWIDLKIILYLFKLQPDIVLCAGSWNLLPALIASFLPLGYLKVFWSEGHKDSVLNAQGPISYMRKWSLRLYDYFAVPNKSSESYILGELGRSVSPKQFICLPNTIDEFVFGGYSCDMQDTITKRLVIVAALEARKGWRDFLNALSLLPISARKRLQIHICGEGEMRNSVSTQLEVLCCDYKLYGQKNPEFVANLLSRSHGFLLNSLLDPNPLSVIEALCVGLPLLVSNRCGNYRECVKPLVNGWTFDPTNALEVSDCLLDWLNSDAHRLKEMSSMSRSVYNACFRSDLVCERFADDISALLS